MNRKSNIPSLLASRVPMNRRPPERKASTLGLRVVRGDAADGDEGVSGADGPTSDTCRDSHSAAPESVPAAIDRLHQSAEAAQTAYDVLTQAGALLGRSLRALDASDGDVPALGLGVGQDARGLDALLREARSGDVRLFDGAFAIVIDAAGSDGALAFELPAMDASCLGDMRSGTLADLIAGATPHPDRERCGRIIRSALRQIDAQRRRLAGFLHGPLAGRSIVLGVMLENLISARSAVDDADFVVAAGRLNRVQILMQGIRPAPRPSAGRRLTLTGERNRQNLPVNSTPGGAPQTALKSTSHKNHR